MGVAVLSPTFFQPHEADLWHLARTGFRSIELLSLTAMHKVCSNQTLFKV